MNPEVTVNLPRPSPSTIAVGTPTEVKKHWVRQYQQLMNALDPAANPSVKKHILYMIIAGLEWDLYAQLEKHKVDMTSPKNPRILPSDIIMASAGNLD
ncbi:unnamed protein product [Clonostachys solani]|uniref:Uncharacterized protein n=1 Tax=Clonostachys solani TaxID=160281 RepID=A0A9N9VZT9_9HYPO|nr:unnamed protein product [Clonostachys solani]